MKAGGRKAGEWVGQSQTRHTGVPTELWQIPVLPEPWAGIEFVTRIMQELNCSPFDLQRGIEEIKLLYLIFNGKKNHIPHSILCFQQIRLFQ